MKVLLTEILLATTVFTYAQKWSGKIEGHDKGEMDIVLTMFGMEKPVKIGTLNANGDFEINLSVNPTEKLSEEERELYISNLSYGFQYVCGNPGDFPEGEAKIASSAQHIALWADNTWAGVLFPVSDLKLQLWMEDNGFNDAVEGSFYQVLLVTEDVNLQKKCTNFDYYNDEDIEVNVEYDLKLKKGLNLIAYQLESVYKTNPDIRASFPKKIRMTNAGDNPKIMWIAKYFF